MKTAAILVDTQLDFCEGGSLAVAGGNSVAEMIKKHLDGTPYTLVLATKDWHIEPYNHFADEPDYKNTWPAHCVVGTSGAEFHPTIRKCPLDDIVYKGQYRAAYSGFEGRNDTDSLLSTILQRLGIESVDIMGIAFDYCVKATALDAVRFGFKTRVIKDLTASVSKEGEREAMFTMDEEGVSIW